MSSDAGFAGGRKDPIGNLILCASSLGFVDLSIINGEIIVKDGQIQSLSLKVFPSLHRAEKILDPSHTYSALF